MKKVATVLVISMAVVLTYAGVKLVDVGADFLSSKRTVVLACTTGATDTVVVETGRMAQELIALGYSVKLCGNDVTRQQAEEMANW
jgi:hypothetical protein